MSNWGPKYWDKVDECVVTGAPVLRPPKMPLELDELCGMYSWICQWDDMTNKIFYPDNKYNSGFITLSLKSGTKATPKDISGALRIWNQTAKFTSLTLLPSTLGCNVWNIECLEWDELKEEELKELGSNRQDQEHNHFILVLDVKNDDGKPFILFTFDRRNGCFSFMGKKQKDGCSEASTTLTEGEYKRLNWDLDRDEVHELWEDKSDDEEGSEVESSGDEEENSNEAACKLVVGMEGMTITTRT